jgi:photosystem II PsbJ protein
MTGTGRIPLWLVALIGGLGVLVVISSFIFGAYSGLGSSL